MTCVEVNLTSGHTVECFDVAETIVHDLKRAFYLGKDDVFKITDNEGESIFRIRDVTSINIFQKEEPNKAGF